ncbi:MAG: AmmeMemoRadiSam system protein B [Thermodesulfobacteriota bacterium]|nr:AmmeMemoRadiSam system protein B [Thermodesulfobacteriota bacterium]
MNELLPPMRKDLEFFPIKHGDRQFILIRDHLGLVQEGKAIALQSYQLITLLDGRRTVRDLQIELIRQNDGVLVGTDEVKNLLAQLDESYFLDSDRFGRARDQIVDNFTMKKIRPCSHCGSVYPDNPLELKNRLDEILNSQSPPPKPEGEIKGLISPHIDLSVGSTVYSNAYRILKYTAPSRIVLLGVGHQMVKDLFSLTDKDFETPLGIIESEKPIIHELRDVGGDIIAANDFAHRSEHSIEFQLIFLKHLLSGTPFTIIPILCGFIKTCLPEYSREAYLEKAGPFLDVLTGILNDQDKETLIVAGVDFSHTGPKFGHEMPASYFEKKSEAHDKNLLNHLSRLDPDHFWEESRRVDDQFNVCGFSALACLLEVLPPCKGQILDYKLWHEEATRSAVSFAAVVFRSS